MKELSISVYMLMGIRTNTTKNYHGNDHGNVLCACISMLYSGVHKDTAKHASITVVNESQEYHSTLNLESQALIP